MGLKKPRATSDVDQMEKLLMKMETDPLVTLDWHGYAAAADAFLKAGQLEKTAALLRKSEQFINRETRKIGYEHLMTSYAAIGSKHEVYRIWELYKNVVGFYNNGYRCMLSSLLKMDDIYGAEKIVEEWESGNKFFNIQIPNLLINAYCRKGLLEKAKSYVKKLSEGGKECCRTWALLATTYHMNDRMEEAVETLKMAASSASRPGWKFDNSTLAACFEYLKQKGDVEKAHELLILFRERGHFTTDLCDKIRNYIGGCAPPGSGVR
ncbi:pentatricopeptide repeat-containing protein At2g20710, mitochondrial-like isoform X2 [Prunus dulcis]|uniref:pentatricopeptide repeat-containing protein At2g20710, mitochondrial-like isoform X2 n=1 Tax=Prunus dulcis TaxID=3755 RepID=UPI0014839B41|nr:pentatricopeptide repeat-containing protein At2g20710, mitochondrial-like isoform X2 [Prunus dulcis]